MTFKNQLMGLNDVLNKRGVLDDVYEGCRTLDMAGAVIAALRVLRNTGNLPEIENLKKNEDLSSSYRIKGQSFFLKHKWYKRALECYNKALLYAPNGSKHLVLAYCNRSELFYKLEAYEESLQDIETCLKFQCEKELLKKLTIKKAECEKMISKEKHTKNFKNSFSEEFFQIEGKIHPEIPCLSADVDVVNESAEMKVVAIKDIPVGFKLAVETAYTTCFEQEQSFLTCYYCQRSALNLSPCNNCCYALFCSKKCKKLCLNEYHNVECQIMDVLRTVDNSSRFRLAIKTVLKIKTQCKEWSTLIEESKNIGANRLKISSTKELYDVDNYSSILSFNGDRHFIHGALYNSCFVYALVIYHLQKIRGFFPVERKKCLEAQKCLAKLFITLELMWPCTTEIHNVAQEPGTGITHKKNLFLHCHYGFFSFTSKLKHACEPNVLLLGMDNKVCLVAIQPIKKTAELKISHIDHWLLQQFKGNQRITKLFYNSFIVCTCRVCKEGWSVNNLKKSDFCKLANEYWHRMLKDKEKVNEIEPLFEETFKTLTVLNNQTQTKEYQDAFGIFCFQLYICQVAASKSYWISC